MTALAYTPYDGSRQPFTIGLAPLDPQRWIEPDERLAADLNEKEELFADSLAAVFAAEPSSADGQAEALAALAAHLAERHPMTHRRTADGMDLPALGRSVRFGDGPALLAAARLVQDDLVLMRRGEAGWRLAAAALCFPSSWSLAEKFGGTLDDIHAQVPGYPAMAVRMARIFDNLKPGIPVWRLNWSIYPDAGLHHPEPRQTAVGHFDDPGAEAFVRVERQTLTRLPATGDILFTIRVLVDPFTAFASHPDGRRLAAGLRQQLIGLDAAQLGYKALGRHRDALAERLAALAGD